MPHAESSDEEGTGEAPAAGSSTFDVCQGQTRLEDPDDDTLRILLSTDNHLGYEENDDVRGLDSFAAFEEVLYLAKRFRCDMVLLAGDLFHENRPSRRTLYKTMEILRRYTMGDQPVQVQILGDPRDINYMNMHVSVDLPIFSIHGNHDDPTRDGGDLLAALDLLHVNLLVNYFGRQSEVSQVQISPVLLQKGTSRVALYGLGSLREERLHRMWREGKVSFLRPETAGSRSNPDDSDNGEGAEEEDGFFNIFALHQNRDLGRGSKNCVQETMIPEWMDVVVWGHEHECLIEFTESVLGTFRISQPGSSVATSLVAGEAVMKKIGIMDIRGKNFRLHTVPLTQVRPFVTNEIILAQHRARLDPEDNHIESKVTRALEEEVRVLILNSLEKHQQVLQQAEEAGSNVAQVIARQKQQQNNGGGGKNIPVLRYTMVHPEKVLVRVRVEHSGFSTLNNQRFGAKFVDEIANSDNVLLFHRKKSLLAGAAGKKTRTTNAKAALKEPMEPEALEDTHMDDLVRDFLEQPNQKLSLLEEKTLSEAMESFVDKNTTQAIPDSTFAQLRQKQKTLITNKQINKGDDVRQAVEEQQQARDASTEKDESMEAPGRSLDDSGFANGDEEEEVSSTAKGGSKRKKATTSKASTRNTGSQRRSLDDDDDEEMENSRGASSTLDYDDDEEITPRAKRITRGSQNLDDDDDNDPSPIKSRTGAVKGRGTTRRTAAKKKVNYSVDNSDDENDEDASVHESDEENDDDVHILDVSPKRKPVSRAKATAAAGKKKRASAELDDDGDDVVVIDEPPKKKPASRTRAAAASNSGRKKRAAATAASTTRKKRAGRSTYLDSDNEDDFRGGSSAARLDDDWGSAATRSQL